MKAIPFCVAKEYLYVIDVIADIAEISSAFGRDSSKNIFKRAVFCDSIADYHSNSALRTTESHWSRTKTKPLSVQREILCNSERQNYF